MKALTPLKWYIDNLEKLQLEFYNDETDLDKFKQKHKVLKKAAFHMEKELFALAYNEGTVNGLNYPDPETPLTGDQYFKQTYKANK